MSDGHLRRQRDPQIEQRLGAHAGEPGGTPGAKPHGWMEVSPPETSVCQGLQEEPKERRFFSKSTKP